MSAKVIDFAEARARLRPLHGPIRALGKLANAVEDCGRAADAAGSAFDALMAAAATADSGRAGDGWAPTPMTLDEIRADIGLGCEQLLKSSHASWCPRHENLDTNCRCDQNAT